jgi:hypothetical protein
LPTFKTCPNALLGASNTTAHGGLDSLNHIAFLYTLFSEGKVSLRSNTIERIEFVTHSSSVVASWDKKESYLFLPPCLPDSEALKH